MADIAPGEIARFASLLSVGARANILQLLLDGRARTAGELAAAAGVLPQTASAHLAKLSEAGLIRVAVQGRHRYHRLANPDVAAVMEALSVLAGSSARPFRTTGPRDAQMREARTCYDHFAGKLGVAIADALRSAGDLIEEDQNFRLTGAGESKLTCIGIDISALRQDKRVLCRWCLDWSERRPHLAGSVGAAITTRCFELGWAERTGKTRAVRVTATGEGGLFEIFGLRWGMVAQAA